MENTLTSEQQRPAPLPPARGSAASLDSQEMFLECLRDGYTLLMRGDVMRDGDESLRLHDRKWIPLPGGWDGHPWESKHWPPVRRKQQNAESSDQREQPKP